MDGLRMVLAEALALENFAAPLIGFFVVVVGGLIYTEVELYRKQKRIERGMLR